MLFLQMQKKRVTNIKILTDLEKSQKAVLNVITLVEKLDPATKDYTKKKRKQPIQPI